MSELTVQDVPEVLEYDANDVGRATRFVDEHHEMIRYVPAWEKWLRWCEHHWRIDDDGEMTRLAVKHSKRLVAEAMEIEGYQERNLAVKAALKVGNDPEIKRMLSLAKADERIVVNQNHLDADPWLLGVKNGVVDLRTGAFREGRREDLITKQAGTSYDPEASCPRWKRFVSEVFADDAALIQFVHKYIGYTLTGVTSDQSLLFCYGVRSNGKTTLIETGQALLGDYGQRAPNSLTTLAKNGNDPFNEIARLHGARMVVGSEIEEGARLAESRVKDITGGDTVTGRFLYEEGFDFVPRLKLWLFGNHKPEIRGGDYGIWRRLRLIPFNVQFDKETRDPNLREKLIKELPGILNWTIRGVELWRREGLVPPAVVTEAVADYQEDEDTLADFLNDETVDDPAGLVNRKQMFTRYQSWASDNRIKLPYTQKGLARRLRDHHYGESRDSSGRYWTGISLKPTISSFADVSNDRKSQHSTLSSWIDS